MPPELLAQLPDLPNPEVGTDPKAYLVLMLVGFVVGAAGHVVQSKAVVALGIAMIFLATVLLPIGLALTR
jgi:hypothetical protein